MWCPILRVRRAVEGKTHQNMQSYSNDTVSKSGTDMNICIFTDYLYFLLLLPLLLNHIVYNSAAFTWNILLLYPNEWMNNKLMTTDATSFSVDRKMGGLALISRYYYFARAVSYWLEQYLLEYVLLFVLDFYYHQPPPSSSPSCSPSVPSFLEMIFVDSSIRTIYYLSLSISYTNLAPTAPAAAARIHMVHMFALQFLYNIHTLFDVCVCVLSGRKLTQFCKSVSVSVSACVCVCEYRYLYTILHTWMG